MQHRGAAHGNKAVRHLPHVRFKHANRNTRRVLEEVVDPGERIRIVGIRAPPHRATAGAVGHAECSAPLAARPLSVAPLEVLQFLDRSLEQRNACVCIGGKRHLHRATGPRGRIEICTRTHQRTCLIFKASNERVDVLELRIHVRLHPRVDRGHNQMDRGLFAAPHARAIATDHGAVGALLEQERREHTDAVVHAGNVDKAIVRVGEMRPHRPVAAELCQIRIVLPCGGERTIGARRHAQVATFARFGIDGNRKQSTIALELRFRRIKECLRTRHRERRNELLHGRNLCVGFSTTRRLPVHLVGHAHVALSKRLTHR